MTFGARLRQLRNGENLTLRELEDETGISFSALGKYERDEREPDFKTLEILATYFGVMIDWLIGRTDIKTFDEYVFINDVRHLEEKIKKMDPEKRGIVVDIVDQVYLIINGHLADDSTDSLEIIFKLIHNLFWLDNGHLPSGQNSYERINKNDPEGIMEFLSAHKNQFNTLSDELIKIQLKTKRAEDF
ncbi:helix-turn-helix domain-containing protein [Sporosarcina psychrophila]|uniref:Transcriptional regulator with XRE-family HTH domain n=1 Tax=Sporosarcina psychrophila TaxID=1476 RepID=A0ABV2K9T5_SPOPS